LGQIEADRLDMMNGIIRLALGKLFLAPVDMSKVKRALDLGTGTGVCGFANSIRGVTLLELMSLID